MRDALRKKMVHRDDRALVTDTDLDWLLSLSEADIDLLKRTDDTFRMDAVDKLTRQGVDGMLASRQCWKTMPTYYVNPERRGANAWRFTGDNSELPIAVKDRVSQLAIEERLSKGFAAQYETTNAAIRALLSLPEVVSSVWYAARS